MRGLAACANRSASAAMWRHHVTLSEGDRRENSSALKFGSMASADSSSQWVAGMSRPSCTTAVLWRKTAPVRPPEQAEQTHSEALRLAQALRAVGHLAYLADISLG